MYYCTERIRVKREIRGYALIDDKGNRMTVAANILKEKMKEGNIKVKNLVLTSDNRLILIEDKMQESTSQTIKKPVVNKMSMALNEVEPDEAKRKYLAKKTNSKRVGTAVKRCLLIGLASVSLASSTGCGAIDNNNYELASEQKDLDRETAIDMIQNAQDINVDMKNFTLKKTYILMIDGQEVAKAKGKSIKLWDTITLNTNTGEEICTGEQGVSVLFDKYTVLDADGNTILYMKEKFSPIFTRFELYDTSDNLLGAIESDSLLSSAADILDANDKVIGTIESGALRKDFTIHFSEDCKIDKVGLTSACCNYVATIANKSRGHSHSSSGGK